MSEPAASSPPPRQGRIGFADLVDALRRVRDRLHMDVIFVSEFFSGSRIFRFVDAATGSSVVKVGDSDTLEDSYCQRIVDGRLPEVIPDALTLPEACALPATHAVGVRGHLSVPIVLSDGHVFGTLCCFSAEPKPELSEQDAADLRAIARTVADGVEDGTWFGPGRRRD